MGKCTPASNFTLQCFISACVYYIISFCCHSLDHFVNKDDTKKNSPEVYEIRGTSNFPCRFHAKFPGYMHTQDSLSRKCLIAMCKYGSFI